MISKQLLQSEYIDKIKSIQQIAKENNFSRTTIRKYLQLYHIPLRGKHAGKNLLGKKFGNLIVISKSKIKDKGKCFRWKCQCICGNKTEFETYFLLSGKRTQCQKCSRLDGAKHLYTGYKELSGGYISQLKKSAKIRSLKFAVSTKYLYDLFQQQHGLCALSGIQIVLSGMGPNKVYQTASVDRINSKKGYIKGNVQWVHKDINMMKQRFSQQYFIDSCILVTKHNLK